MAYCAYKNIPVPKVTVPVGTRVSVDGALGQDRPAPVIERTPVRRREVVLRRTADPKVFRSDALMVVADGDRGR